MDNLSLIAIALLPPVLIGVFLYFRDKYVKEPLKLILMSFFLGWLIVLPILGLHYFLMNAGVYGSIESVIGTDTFANSFFQAFIMAALIEEAFKYLAFRKGIWRSRYFDEYYDGILYAALISLGFAAFENIFYVFQHGFYTGISRAFTAIPAHTFFGITMGFYFSRAKFNHTNTSRNLWLALLIPVLLHGLYDLILFEIVRIEDSSHPFYYPSAIAFWVLMVWMFVRSRRRIRKMLRRDEGNTKSKV